jgi:hypothetical protein
MRDEGMEEDAGMKEADRIEKLAGWRKLRC